MEKLIKRLDKLNIRVKTKDKVPQVLDWVNYKEERNIKQLLEENEEYGLRTGTKLGNYWFCCLDIDKQGWVKICEYLSYVRTKRGIHIYLLIGGKEPSQNSMLFYQGKRIGDLLSKGKQVVGVGSVDKELVQRGKWFWKFESTEELKKKLGEWEIELR